MDAESDDDGRFEAMVTRDGSASVSAIPLDHSMKHVDFGKKRGDLGDIELETGVTIRPAPFSAASMGPSPCEKRVAA